MSHDIQSAEATGTAENALSVALFLKGGVMQECDLCREAADLVNCCAECGVVACDDCVGDPAGLWNCPACGAENGPDPFGDGGENKSESPGDLA